MNTNQVTSTKKCKYCQSEIDAKASKCPKCQADLRSWVSKHPILTILALLFIVPTMLGITMGSDPSTSTPEQPQQTPEEIAAFEASPAGKLCKEHSTWTPEECQRVVDKKIWIGMHYDMIVYQVGKPDSTNTSNYGSGTRMQWCWHDFDPNCFYDNNGDQRIDSYN
jgi:hypothetical protein